MNFNRLLASIHGKRKDEKGFTLIELIIVIAIIGILVAIAIPVYGAIQNNAKHKAAKAAATNAYSQSRAILAEKGFVYSNSTDNEALDALIGEINTKVKADQSNSKINVTVMRGGADGDSAIGLICVEAVYGDPFSDDSVVEGAGTWDGSCTSTQS